MNWFWISPELVLTIAGLASLLFAAARGVVAPGPAGKHAPGAQEGGSAATLRAAEWLSIAGVAVAGILALWVGLSVRTPQPQGYTHFWGGMTHDPFSAYFKVAVSIGVLLVMAMTAGYRRAMFNRPELYGLLALATLAIFFMASASEMVMVFLAIEFLSIVSYVMVGYLKDEPRSAEAGLKYFLFGAVCSAVMLYGMSLLYGITGTTTFQGMEAKLSAGLSPVGRQVVVLSALLLLAGLGFKVSLVPFQQWVPDVYEGAPTPITAFLSVASKAAGFAVATRILVTALGAPEIAAHWSGIVAVLAIITMTWGNTAAIGQKNIKRMLAYSSIAHAGYILVGVVAAGYGGAATNQYAIPGILLYVLAYVFMNLGAFAVVIAVANQTGTEEISGYAGLSRRAPLLAAAFTFFLISLIGIPPTAGFIAKLYLFLAAVEARSPMLWWAAVAMLLNSVVSAYYYLNVVRQMYLQEPKEESPVLTNRALVGTLVVAAVATFVIFLGAQPFIDVARATAQASPLHFRFW